MRLLFCLAGLFLLVAAQNDSPPDLLTIYSLITGSDDTQTVNETDVQELFNTEKNTDDFGSSMEVSGDQVKSSIYGLLTDNDDSQLFNETDVEESLNEKNSQDYEEPELSVQAISLPPMKPPHPKPFGVRRPGPGRFAPGPGRFPPGPGRFPPGPGRFPPGPGRFPPGPGRFPPGPSPFGPGRGGRRPFPPGPRPFPHPPHQECEQWNDWQKATCFWPNQTLEDLPYNCRVVPVKDSWPTYLKKFVQAKVVEGYNMIVDEFKRRGAPERCGFCSRSFECRLRNSSRTSSRFCPLKEVRPVDEDCGDSDACVLSEERGGCPAPFFLHRPDDLDNMRQMIQKKQYKKFAAHLLNMKKSEGDRKPEHIRFKRAPGFGDDYPFPDLSFYSQMMQAAMYHDNFNGKDINIGNFGRENFRPSFRENPSSNFDFNGKKPSPRERGSFQEQFNAYQNSMPSESQRNGRFPPQGMNPSGPSERTADSFKSMQDSPFASAGRPGNAGLNNRKQRRAQPSKPFEMNREDESEYPENNDENMPRSGEPKPFGPRSFGPSDDSTSGRGPQGPSPFGPKPFGPRRFGPRHFEPRPFGPRSFGPREFGPRSFGPRQFEPRPFGPRPFGPRQFEPRPFGPGEFGPRPFGPREFEPRPFGPRQFEPRPFGPGEFGPRPFGPREFEPRPFGPRQFEPRPYGLGEFGPRPFGPGEFGPRAFGPGEFGPRPFGPGQFEPRPFGPGEFEPRPFGPSEDFPFAGPQGPAPFGSKSMAQSKPFPHRQRGPARFESRPFGPSDDFPSRQGRRGPAPFEQRPFEGRPFNPSDNYSDDMRGPKPSKPFDNSEMMAVFNQRFAREQFNKTMDFSKNRDQLEAMKMAMFNHMRAYHQDARERIMSRKLENFNGPTKNMEKESRMLLANLLHGTTCASVNHKCLCCCGHHVPNVDTGKCEDLRQLLPGIEDALNNFDKDESIVEPPMMPSGVEMKKKAMKKTNGMEKMQKPDFFSQF